MISWKKRISKDDKFIDLSGLPYYNIHWDATSKIERVYEYDVCIPAEPADHHCVNYGLSEHDQIFRKTLIPKQVINPSSKDGWSQDDIDAFIDAEWNRRRNGIWVFIKGKKTYVPGLLYMKMNYWKSITGIEFIYKFSDWEFFIFWMHCVYDPKCEGMADFKCRQIGDTENVVLIMWEYGSRVRGTVNTIQSCINETHAKKTYFRLVHGHKKMIYYFRPLNQGTEDPKKGLNLSYPAQYQTHASIREKVKTGEMINRSSSEDYEYPEINSQFYFGPSKVSENDGSTIGRGYLDEFGKCFSAKTKLLMHDGNYKFAKDIKVGDELMGDDSEKRTVIKTNSGIASMYKIAPKSNGWEEWECNGSHVLTMKWGRNEKYCKWRKDEIVEMSVIDFINQPEWVKKHMCLYRVGVDYSKKDIGIDPYLLGLWLGDGNSRAAKFATNDFEIVDYLNQYCVRNNLTLAHYGKFEYGIIRQKKTEKKNPLMSKLLSYKLIKNKHIPLDYLLNNRENRLSLLAGLIDSDGYLMHSKNGYEFCQKNKRLAFQVKKLALELGYKATIAKKNAQMKRTDGSTYRCMVYIISIFGKNLYEVPCIIKRKQISKKEIIHVNTRDSLKTCFSATKIDNGVFYGFETDGNHRILLRDCQVVHNCDGKLDPVEWIRVMVEAAYSRILDRKMGLLLLTSTVEEIIPESLAWAMKIWTQADPASRTSDGKTANGLYRCFRSAIDRGEVDRWGFPMREKIIEKINSTIKILMEKGDIKGVISFRRKNCLTIDDVFKGANDNSQFDIEKLERRYFYVMNEAPKSLYVRGNLKWKDGIKDSIVIWEPNSKGKWVISKHPRDFGKESNAKVMGVIAPKPANIHTFCCGVDPIDQKTVLDDNPSQGAITVLAKLDEHLDGSTDRYYQFNDPERNIIQGDPVDGGTDFMTNRVVCTYLFDRQKTTGDPNEYFEDCILTWVYYGTDALVEKNKSAALFTYLSLRNYELYKMERPTSFKNYRGQEEREGVTATEGNIDAYFSFLTTLSCKWWNTIDHPDLLEQMLSMNYANRGKKDLGVSTGWAYYAATIPRSRFSRAPEDQKTTVHFVEQYV